MMSHSESKKASCRVSSPDTSGEHAAGVTRNASFLQGTPEPQWEMLDLGEVVRDVCGGHATRCATQRIHVTCDVAELTSVLADRNMIRHAVDNLIDNALDAMPRGGELVITVWMGSEQIEIEVADSGPGIDEEIRSRALDRNETTRRQGAGLGLSVVRQIAGLHQGDMTIQNCPEGGAAITLHIPRRAMKAAA